MFKNPYSESELLDILYNKVAVYNGGVRCDTIEGPCACGAWHNPDEMAEKIQELIEPTEGDQ